MQRVADEKNTFLNLNKVVAILQPAFIHLFVQSFETAICGKDDMNTSHTTRKKFICSYFATVADRDSGITYSNVLPWFIREQSEISYVVVKK